ncbi:C40 family peptidase [Neobacillus sp. SuZ13]|uniref:C40 family peptidase n=1 Tax=Neobacillus sp. SuZ13 TaxID=3047875 RepID=UPI0024C00664|nr:C40 family peptidase [Neobacillus sp. SuZ13]WHY66465.1 NlpC/P60 family protein [Neobacillus sp. SuZ13]
MKRKLLIYSVSIALLTSVFQATPTFASPTVTQDQINHTKVKITETQNQIEDIENKIQQLDDRIVMGMEKSKQLNTDIKVQQGQIVKTKADIEKAKQDLETNKTYYSARLKTMQEQGQQPMITYAEFILSSDSFSQLLTRSTAIMQILDSNTDIMKALSKKEENLLGAEQKLENELGQLKKSQEDLASKQKQIEADKAEIKTVLAESKNTLKQQQTQLASQQTLKIAQDKARQEAQARAQREAQERAAAQERARQAAPERAEQQAPKSPSQPEQESPAKKPVKSNDDDDTPKETVINSGDADELIAYAKQFLGVKYVWGGTTPNGFDCSGFTQYVFRHIGISLPRVSRDQQDIGTSISPYNVKKGDLIFRGNPAHHVGIYIGGGKYIHAPQTGDVVKISTYNPSTTTTAARVLH